MADDGKEITTLSLPKRTKRKLEEYKSGSWKNTFEIIIKYFHQNGHDDLVDLRYEMKNGDDDEDE